jgi:hypothetical protein
MSLLTLRKDNNTSTLFLVNLGSFRNSQSLRVLKQGKKTHSGRCTRETQFALHLNIAEGAEVTWQSEGCLRTVCGHLLTVWYWLPVFLVSYDVFSLLILGVKGYCCVWSYSHMHNIQKRNIHGPGGIRTRNPSKPTAIFLRLRQRGHRDRPVIQQQRLTVEGKDASSNFSRGKNPTDNYSTRKWYPRSSSTTGFTRESK